MSKQRTRKFVTKILRKTCSSLVKLISEGEINFTQNKYNMLQKISAKNKCLKCTRMRHPYLSHEGVSSFSKSR